MTTSPESRARELHELLKGIRWPAEAEAVPLIAAAIREAENAALERAAEVLRHRALTLLPPDTQLLAKAAQSIRSLKHPKD